MAKAIMQTKRMKIHLCDLKPRTDLGGTLGKNPLEEKLVRLRYKFAKSTTETNRKV